MKSHYVYVLYGCYQDITMLSWRDSLIECLKSVYNECDVIELSLITKANAEKKFGRNELRYMIEKVSLSHDEYLAFSVKNKKIRINSRFLLPAYFVVEMASDIRESSSTYRHMLRMASDSPTSYGIMYTRNVKNGPSHYAIGIGIGLKIPGKDYREGLLISRWGYSALEKEIFKQGVIRDVYCENIFNCAQMQIILANNAVSSFLNSNKHVNITKHGHNHTIVSIANECIREARDVFSGLGEFYYPNTV